MMVDGAQPTKLVMMIVSDSDADELLDALVEQGLPTTKVGSSGGFLRHGNVTIFSGVPGGEVDRVLEIVNEICHARREFVPVQPLPFDEAALNAEPIEVRVGGAIVFVLDIERFQRV